jgi:hypothetical protein
VADDRTPNELGIGLGPGASPDNPAGLRPATEAPPAGQQAGAGRTGDAMCQKADWLAPTTELPATTTKAPVTATTATATLVPPAAAAATATTAAAELPAVAPSATDQPGGIPATEDLPAEAAGPQPEAAGPQAEAAELQAEAGGQQAEADGLPAEPASERLRRWGRDYGGYVAAGALAVAVLICSAAGVSQVAMTWHPGAGAAVASPSSAGPSPSPAAQPALPLASPSPSPSRQPTRRPAAAAAPRSQTPPPGPSASAKPRLLGPDDADGVRDMVNDQCRRSNRSATLLRPWPGSGAMDNWACKRRHGREDNERDDTVVVNMTDVCVQRYGSGMVASYLDAKDPFSWRCYRR